MEGILFNVLHEEINTKQHQTKVNANEEIAAEANAARFHVWISEDVANVLF